MFKNGHITHFYDAFTLILIHCFECGLSSVFLDTFWNFLARAKKIGGFKGVPLAISSNGNSNLLNYEFLIVFNT